MNLLLPKPTASSFTPSFNHNPCSTTSVVAQRSGTVHLPPTRSSWWTGAAVQVPRSNWPGRKPISVRCGHGSCPVRRKRLAVFVSGGGSNFRSIHEMAQEGSIHGDVVALVTDKPDCGGAKYAMDNNIPIIPFPKTKYSIEGLTVVDLVTKLKVFKIDFVLLAGYLKLIPVELVQAFPRSILNIHPSLLPAFGGKGFYGPKVHKAVVASGARYSGPTIHFVDENYDTGQILAQRVVPVLTTDTPEQLAARVLKEENKLYVEVVAVLCEERIMWREDGVPLIRSKDDPHKYL